MSQTESQTEVKPKRTRSKKTVEAATKPPTQGVGVTGFVADQYASDLPKKVYIRWDILEHLPKYQMFIVELSRFNIANVMEWCRGFTQDMVYKHTEDGFFKMYCDWHDKKGYWNNEDYYGGLN
ncbi:hypothetical protein [Acinetobacter lwoffii]|uniref:hypothetical protein n=1 Tax=Acinetobacter lwoffii TaxID=28090 RepID=UPI003F8CFD41